VLVGGAQVGVHQGHAGAGLGHGHRQVAGDDALADAALAASHGDDPADVGHPGEV
jgi:hypothetical protein